MPTPLPRSGDLPEPALVHHHGNPVHLAPGRYWIGDPAALGYNIEQMHDVIDEHDLDGIYVQNGIVVGTFCRSLWPDASYRPKVGPDYAGSDRDAIRSPHHGVSILPVEDEQILSVSQSAADGMMLDLAQGGIVSRVGYNGGDILISSIIMEGQLLRLWLLN